MIEKNILLQEFKNGLWFDEIGQKYGVSGRTIRIWCNNYNIDLPRKNKKKDKQKFKCKRCGKEYYTTKHEGYCSVSCWKLDTEEIDTDFLNTENEIGLKIQELRKQRLSYSEIASKLNIAKSTVNYYCCSNSKKLCTKRAHKFEWKYIFIRKIDEFKTKISGNPVSMGLDWNKKFRSSCSRFRLKNMNTTKFTYKEALEHLGGTLTKCYLTGREINILKDDYCLDHIIPASKGGTNDLDNMGITIPIVNASKSNMTVEEYLALCKEVLEYNGYKVEKINEL